MRTKMKWLAAIGLIMFLLFSICAATAEEVTETLSASVSTKGTPPAEPEIYTICLSAEGDFPMPEGANGRTYDLKITGAASADFPKISYDRVGIYTYTVRQIPGLTEGVQYDSSVYDVKVQVYHKKNMNGFEIATAVRKRGNKTKVPITFVNTYPVELVSKTVVKNWDDVDNQDGIRPTELSATLTSSENMTPVHVTLNKDNNWTETVTKLPRFVEDTRNEITYTWTEGEIPSTYIQTDIGPGPEENVTIITNQHVPYTVDVSVEKIWDDADNQDGIRPSGDQTVRVKLLANDVEKQEVYLKEADGWKATVSGLPKNENGKAIIYRWEEDSTTVGYKLTGNATGSTANGQLTTLVNTHETAKTSATIVKNWNDANNQDGIRPDHITATLSDGTEVTLNEENNWRATVENLPKFSNGKEIEYTWKEDSIAGYTLTGTSTSGTVTTITNTHTPATKDVEIRKVWVDNDNEYGRRTPVTLVLTASANQSAVATYTWDVRDGETLSHTFTVPVYNNGNELIYTVDEQTVPAGYIKTVDNSTLTVTNTFDLNEATVDIQITKSWADDGNRDGVRPPNIVVKLLRNGEEMNTVTMTGTGDLWSYMLTGLPRYTNKAENVYTIAEVNVPGYTSSIQDFAITNTHTIETTSRTVTKVWNDNNNAGFDRPAELTVTLNANGTAIRTVTLNEANDWTATASDLPVNENGRPIAYSWTEPAVDHYTLADSVTEGSVTTLTNRRIVPFRLRIDYQYIDGREAATSVERMLYAGEQYDFVSPVIPGYTATLLRVQGTMPNHDVEYLVLYLPGEGLRILEDYKTPLGLGNVFINIGDCIE